jgi:hypothetical protein
MLAETRHEDAAVLAYDILQIMAATIPNDDEDKMDPVEQLYRLVVFLWAVAIGLTYPVNLTEALETNEIEDMYATMLEDMEKSWIAQRRNQPDAFAYEMIPDDAQRTGETGTSELEEDWEFRDSKPPAKSRR